MAYTEIDKDPEIYLLLKDILLNNPHKPLKALAMEMDRTEDALRDLYRLDRTRYLWATEVVQITRLTQDYRLIELLAERCDGFFVHLGQFNDDIAELATALRESADFCTKTADCLADGKVTSKELKQIEKEGREAVEAVLGVMRKCGVDI